MKKSSCDETCEEVVDQCKPIIAELSQLALRFLELGERYDPRGVAAQLRAMAVANRGVEEQRDALLVSQNEPPIHTRIKVSDLRLSAVTLAISSVPPVRHISQRRLVKAMKRSSCR